MRFLNLKKANGSRTIVHHRGAMPEITFEDFEKLDLSQYSWIHFEGGFHSSTQSERVQKIEPNFTDFFFETFLKFN